ncbi:MAG TPA: methyltransferase [Candidatus Cloacimonadota bacterium]|nr:methyltransferase [Candidatus Cloacimonadota bacterium]
MQYDPIKNIFNRLIEGSDQLRILFFSLLDVFFLRQRYVKRSIRKYFDRSDSFRFYDAGAGFCQYSWHILKKYPHSRVFAVDLKKDYLRSFAGFIRPRMPERFHFQEADLQVFEPKLHYDLAVAIDILEHIPDDVSAMKNIYNCLNPNGKLIISTPSDTDEAARFTEEHVRPGYDMHELRTKLESVGFIIRESHFSYGVWGARAWRLMIKHPLALLGRSKFFFPILPLYYLFVLPLGLIMMQMDLQRENSTGTGIIVVAEKPETL